MSNAPNSSRDVSFDAATLQEASIQAVWGQWTCLGAHALGPSSEPQRSIIDPEALLLFTLYLEPHERRLRDFAYWWAQVGAHLLSVQRTKTLLRRFPSVTETQLSDFATWAVAAGDKRWKRYVGSNEESSDTEPSPPHGREESLLGPSPRPGKGSDRPRLNPLPALVLRLRAGFGISAKADVLAYLLGAEERPARTQAIADATHYSRATVANALKDLCDAGFIQKTTDAVAQYVAVLDQWAPILNGPQPIPDMPSAADGPPVWRYWAGLFAFLADADRWMRDTAAASDYVRSSKARDVFEHHRAALEANQIRVPRPETYRGPDYLVGFADTLRRVVQWLSEHL